jgi:hypothetical protein
MCVRNRSKVCVAVHGCSVCDVCAELSDLDRACIYGTQAHFLQMRQMFLVCDHC